MTRSALCLLLLAGCAHAAPAPDTAPGIQVTVDDLAADLIAHAIVQRAFDADTKFKNPDSLYVLDAEVVANGAPRADAPRLAGIGENGSIQIGSSRFAVTGNYVWGSVQYRWVPESVQRKMIDGWATFIIARLKGGEWRIVHVHSSTTTPEPKDSSDTR